MCVFTGLEPKPRSHCVFSCLASWVFKNLECFLILGICFSQPCPLWSASCFVEFAHFAFVWCFPVKRFKLHTFQQEEPRKAVLVSVHGIRRHRMGSVMASVIFAHLVKVVSLLQSSSFPFVKCIFLRGHTLRSCKYSVPQNFTHYFQFLSELVITGCLLNGGCDCLIPLFYIHLLNRFSTARKSSLFHLS